MSENLENENLSGQNQWRPAEPNKTNLQIEASQRATGANVHSMGNLISAILMRFELGEEAKWKKEDREFYDQALNEFYRRLSGGNKI